MCVAAICEHARLTDIQVEQMWDQNKFGGGVAYRGLNAQGQMVVKWEKGLSKEEMLERNRTLPRPYVMHFRVPSNDTSTLHLACHPFQIDDNATVGFEGETDGFVLFHNGYWTDWRNKLQQISLNGFVRIPSGPWSDSRALALAAHHLGLGFLELVNEKVVAFGPDKWDIEVFGSWLVIKNPDENGEEQPILVTNKAWERYVPAPLPIKVTDHREVQMASQRPGGADAPLGPTFSGTHGHSAESLGDSTNNEESVSQETKDSQQGAVEVDEVGRASALEHCWGCKKRTPAGQMYNDNYYCFQCWADRTRRKKPIVGQCGTCRINWAAAKQRLNDQWICNDCWRTNSRPKVYLMGGQEGYRG